MMSSAKAKKILAGTTIFNTKSKPKLKNPPTGNNFLSLKHIGQRMLKMGLIKPSRSRNNSTLFMLPKKDGNSRVVQDLRELNANSFDDR